MSNLPEDILLIIFDHLDDESMWNALQASKFWARIFSNSSKHFSKFTLHLNSEKVDRLSNIKNLPDVPIIKISIDDSQDMKLQFRSEDINKMSKIIDFYKESIKIVELKNFELSSTDYLLKIIKSLKRLESISFENCKMNDVKKQLPKFMHLKSIYFHESDDELFKIFHAQKNVENISIVRMEWGNDFSWADFDEMAKNYSNLNKLVMRGHGTANYFEHGGFPFKIRKLDVFLMTFDWTNHLPRTRFLESQKGSLKVLILEKLPYDYDGGAVLKYIIEEMKLNTFYYGKIPLILGGRKQEVMEFRVQEVQIQAAFEMFRQFPTITKFSLFLTQTGLDADAIGEIINQGTMLFTCCKELEIEDRSNYETLLVMFTGLYKNFRNIRKLTIISPDLEINSVLEECLPEFTHLNEICLKCDVPNSMQRLQLIRVFAPNIKKLSINEEFVNDAREFFGNDVEVVEI
ncbi:hypothetical protein ACKWTF_015771 [Chironomus riparius]